MININCMSLRSPQVLYSVLVEETRGLQDRKKKGKKSVKPSHLQDYLRDVVCTSSKMMYVICVCVCTCVCTCVCVFVCVCVCVCVCVHWCIHVHTCPREYIWCRCVQCLFKCLLFYIDCWFWTKWTNWTVEDRRYCTLFSSGRLYLNQN